MAITIDKVAFKNLSRIGLGSSFRNVINGDIKSESELQDYIDALEEYRNIQSVLIDWNGANLDGAPGENPGTINTTGDLIRAIKWASTAGGRISDTSSGGILVGKLSIPESSSATNNRVVLGGYGTNKTLAFIDDIKTYTAGSGLELIGGTEFSHSNNITSRGTSPVGVQTPGFGGTFKIPYYKYDSNGHITGYGTTNVTLPSAPSGGGSSEGVTTYTYYNEDSEGIPKSASIAIPNYNSSIILSSEDGGEIRIDSNHVNINSGKLVIGEDNEDIAFTTGTKKLIYNGKEVATKEDIVVPKATVSTLGGIKVGRVYDFSVATRSSFDLGVSNDELEHSGDNAHCVEIDSNGKAFVYVKPTTYSTGDGLWMDGSNKIYLVSATSSTLGGIKTGYATNLTNKNYKVLVDASGNAFVNVPWSDTNTTYSIATDSELGLIKTGYTTSGKKYKVQVDSNGNAYVDVPWGYTTGNSSELTTGSNTTAKLWSAKVLSDYIRSKTANVTIGTSTLAWNTEVTLANIDGVDIKAKLPTAPSSQTIYSAGTGLNLINGTFNHINNISAGTASGSTSKVLSWGGTFEIPSITYDSTGHITETGVTTMTMPNKTTTYLYAGSGSAVNATTSNGNTKITIAENTTVNSSISVKGTGATTVTSDNKGVITINSTNTTYLAATSSNLGLIKLGSDTRQSTAIVTPTSITGRTYAVQTNNNGLAVVNVPWIDSSNLISEDNNQIVVKDYLSIPKIGNSSNVDHLSLRISSGSKTIANIDDIKEYHAEKGIELDEETNTFRHSNNVEAKASGLYKLSFDSEGHITEATEVTAEDLTALLDNIYERKQAVTPSVSFSSATISRPLNKSSLNRIEWVNSPNVTPTQIESGKTGTLNKGKVNAYYNNSNGTATITYSNFSSTPTITSSNTNIITVGTPNNGSCTLTGVGTGKATITVKDGSEVIKTQEITVSNVTTPENVTSKATFSVSAGSISGTTITAPTVTSNTTVTVSVTYSNKTANEEVTYTAIPLQEPAITYYFSIGTTPVTADNYTTANGATTTIPTTTEYTSTQRTYHYILIPDNKTLIITDKNVGTPIPVIEQTSISIPNHKLYKTNGAIANGGTAVITLS